MRAVTAFRRFACPRRRRFVRFISAKAHVSARARTTRRSRGRTRRATNDQRRHLGRGRRRPVVACSAASDAILGWLDVLLKGKPEQQEHARTEIAMILEARGFDDDAEEAYWTNVQARSTDRRAYERLIALYQLRKDRLSESLVRKQLDEVFRGDASRPRSTRSPYSAQPSQARRRRPGPRPQPRPIPSREPSRRPGLARAPVDLAGAVRSPVDVLRRAGRAARSAGCAAPAATPRRPPLARRRRTVNRGDRRSCPPRSCLPRRAVAAGRASPRTPARRTDDTARAAAA